MGSHLGHHMWLPIWQHDGECSSIVLHVQPDNERPLDVTTRDLMDVNSKVTPFA